MQFNAFRVATATLFMAALAACGGSGGSATSPDTPTSTDLTVTGTAATGLAIPGATVAGKCKVGTGAAITLADGSCTLTITDGELPCVLEITGPLDGIKLHTVVAGSGRTATPNITPLTEMATARIVGGEPNVFFTEFDATVATQKITSTTIQTAQTGIGFVLTGTVDTTALGDFIFAPLKAATHDRPSTGDTQDKLLDALKLKLTSTQIGTITTALAGNETTNSIRQLVLTSVIGLKNILFDHFAKINSKKNADFATENVKNTYTYATSVGVRVSGNGLLIAANAASFKKLLIIFYQA